MMMADFKIDDIVSVERWHTDGKLVTVGKIYSLSEDGGTYVGIQVGFEKYKQVKLCDCWNATPTQRKNFFKAMLGG
jgi:hypothetical protein